MIKRLMVVVGGWLHRSGGGAGLEGEVVEGEAAPVVEGAARVRGGGLSKDGRLRDTLARSKFKPGIVFGPLFIVGCIVWYLTSGGADIGPRPKRADLWSRLTGIETDKALEAWQVDIGVTPVVVVEVPAEVQVPVVIESARFEGGLVVVTAWELGEWRLHCDYLGRGVGSQFSQREVGTIDVVVDDRWFECVLDRDKVLVSDSGD